MEKAEQHIHYDNLKVYIPLSSERRQNGDDNL